MATWKDVNLGAKLYENVNEAVFSFSHAALENEYINEVGGHTRFPGLKPFVSGLESSQVYMHDWKGDMIAGTQNGLLYRVDENGVATDVTGVPISGGKRLIFEKTPNELLIAAGAQVMRFAGDKTEVLSENAPLATHVGYISRYIIANELSSARAHHCDPGLFRTWPALNLITADSKPDDMNALLVTPFREVLLCGEESVEQWEPLPNGTTPFFRRWAVGEGLKAPYTLLVADNGNWGINKYSELVRFSGQVAQPTSDDIGKKLDSVTDWTGAWTSLANLTGQKFILLQIPNAVNVYGTKGITSLFDYRAHKWFNLYGWDNDLGCPTIWPGGSHYYFDAWNRHFVGGKGKIWELDDSTYTNDGDVQRVYSRTGQIKEWGESELQNLRLLVKRGVVGSNDPEPHLWLRCCMDNEKWTRWKQMSLGTAGNRLMNLEFGPMGMAHTWQIEYFITDACAVEVTKMQVQVGPVGW